MTYYEDVNIWSLDGEPLVVAEDHDHLGLIVSGQDEEMKNVDIKIDLARQMLYNLLGIIFSLKVLLHVWSVYVSPTLRSGLAALPVKPQIMKNVSNFHHKILRQGLKKKLKKLVEFST